MAIPRLRSLEIDWKNVGLLEPALRELAAHSTDLFHKAGPTVRLVFELHPEMQGFSYTESEGLGVIRYGAPCDAFRAMARVQAGGAPAQEERKFAALGVMLDVSRSGVLKTSGIKRLIRSFALMGINTLQLYLEDVYTIEGEPFFGYFRGRYSAEELKEVDDYADLFGMEVVPCIQTLGHLEQILQWPAYAEIVDVPEVMLAGHPRTEALISKMLDTMRACFRSRRIHIGMDEAHGLGLGRYRLQNGDRRPFDVLNEHLQLVNGLCRDRGLEPLIWSDMYFRLGSATDSYYDPASEIPEGVAEGIPADVTLVYWDYYHWTSDFYTEWISRHRKMGKEPVFAAGAWTWDRLWTHYPLAFAGIEAGMKAAREEGLAEAFLTLWGDDGMECDLFSMLPAVQYFVECAYGAPQDEAALSQIFAATCQGRWDRCLLAGGVDSIPALGPVQDSYGNFGKWILWHDPLLGFLEAHIAECVPDHYRQLAAALEADAEPGLESESCRFATCLAKVLTAKARIHRDTRTAYRNGDVKVLRRVVEEIPGLVAAVEELQQAHRGQWLEWYKPFGWDALERRYAGLISRLRTLRGELELRLSNSDHRILELEEEPLRLLPGKKDTDFHFNYPRASTANARNAV